VSGAPPTGILEEVNVASPTTTGLVLDVRGLSVEAAYKGQTLRLVEDVSFSVGAGRTVGLVGESGSGKSVTAAAVGGLLAPGLRVAAGAVVFEGTDLVNQAEAELRRIRGARIGFVFQDPQNCLDPSFTVGDQLVEAITAHQPLNGAEARARAVELLDRVGIARAAARLDSYPHQFSGGMAQRVMLAIAISCRPRLLIADEPTTALDVTVQAQILELLLSLKAEFGLSLLLISHDLGVIAEMSDDLAVMYAGQIVETGPTPRLFRAPGHPYLSALTRVQPEAAPKGSRLATIPGSVPSAVGMPPGCRFHPRCAHAVPACSVELVALTHAPRPGSAPTSPASAAETRHQVRCLRWGEIELAGVSSNGSAHAEAGGGAAAVAVRVGSRSWAVPVDGGSPGSGAPVGAPLLEVRDLTKRFDGPRRLFRDRTTITAVDGVSFQLTAGETLGLVGETGAGKSTVGRLVLGLEKPSGGSVLFRGAELGVTSRRAAAVHRDIQVIFQNPYASLNPAMTVADLVAEPIDVHERRRVARRERITDLLAQVGLDPSYYRRYVYQLSGGQLQRVAIARALSVNPALIVCDEPVSSLDVSSQAQVINLLEELQESRHLSYLFIGHNLPMVAHMSDRLAIMYRGQVMELGDSEVVYHQPRHPYTRRLLGAMLSVDPGQRRLTAGRTVAAQVPDAEGGCPFVGQCPVAEARCHAEAPPDVTTGDGVVVRCHLVDEGS
jgi:peptide/nickel transport system ATP-binding protein